MDIDVALVPAQARDWRDTVCVVVDELRASSTITTLLDLGCAGLFLTRGLDEARRLARQYGLLLAGERRGRTPRGFDLNNSPAELSRADIGGRAIVLSTSNGTAVLNLLKEMPAVLVGCLLNARACAEAAVGLADSTDARIGIVCAGVGGRFALDDAVAAGVLVDRLRETIEARSGQVRLSDAALAAARLRAGYPDVTAALEESASGHLVREIGAAEDIRFCARLDASRSVGMLGSGPPMRIDRVGARSLGPHR